MVSPLIEAEVRRHRVPTGLTKALPLAAYVCSYDGVIIEYNRAAVQLWGRAPRLGDRQERFSGAKSLWLADGSALPPEQSPTARVLASGKPEQGVELLIERGDGYRRRVLVDCAPLFDETGTVCGALSCLRDISELAQLAAQPQPRAGQDRRQEARPVPAPGRRGEERARFLAQAGLTLSSSLDYHKTLSNVAQLAVPGIADWCAVDVLDQQGRRQRVAIAHVDPAKIQFVRELESRYPPREDSEHGPAAVMRSGKPLFVAEIPDGALVEAARDENHLKLLRELKFKSYMCVPLTAHGRTIGAVTLVSAESDRVFDDEDLALAEVLAAQAALAVDNARLYEEAQKEIAERSKAEQQVERLNSELGRRLNELRLLLQIAPVGIGISQDPECREVQVNPAGAIMLGISTLDNASKSGPEGDKLPYKAVRNGRQIPTAELPMQYAVRHNREVREYEYDLIRKDGQRLNLLQYATPLHDEHGEVRGVFSVFADVTALKRAERQIHIRARQQAAAARLGQRALQSIELETLFEEAVEAISEGLGTPLCKILELQQETNRLLLKAGKGWQPELIGTDTVDAGLHSAAGYTLRTHGPVITRDMTSETRFAPSPLLRSHGAVSGISVLIDTGEENPYGVVGAYTREPRDFSEDDVNFLMAVANVLGAEMRRRRIEQSLRDSQERLRFILEAAEVGTWEWDIATGALTWSDNMPAIRDMPPESFDGTIESFRRDVHPSSRPEVEAAIERAIREDSELHVEYRLNREDKMRWFEGKGRVFRDRDGRPRRLAGICMDITLRKLAQERFRLAVEASPAGMVLVDGHGIISMVNGQAERLFGYDREELKGQAIEMLIPERYRGDHVRYRESLTLDAPRATGFGRDLHGLRKDGGEFPVEIALNPLAMPDGRYFLVTVIDNTERKRAEQEITRINAVLRQQNAEMEQFLYTVSHDLKSPLITIMGFTGVLRENLMAGDMNEADDSMARIARAAERMSRLIDDLLQLSRIKRLELRQERVDVAELVREVGAELSARLAEANAELIVQPDMPAAWADRSRLTEVFENLITNALKYGCQDGRCRITVGGALVAGECQYFVKDEGPGIDSAHHRKIFGLFERLNGQGAGAGVGLTVVEKIVQLHGGRVWVESERGHGATFWLAIPREQ